MDTDCCTKASTSAQTENFGRPTVAHMSAGCGTHGWRAASACANAIRAIAHGARAARCSMNLFKPDQLATWDRPRSKHPRKSQPVSMAG